MTDPDVIQISAHALDDPLIPDSQVGVSVYPGVTTGQLRQMRYMGTGPRYTKIGRKVFYRLSDLVAYAEQNERTSTAEAV